MRGSTLRRDDLDTAREDPPSVMRRSQLQSQAKAGDLPEERKRTWHEVEKHAHELETIRCSAAQQLGRSTPTFPWADRESAMTSAYSKTGARSAPPVD
jgi:hypothetical protein